MAPARSRASPMETTPDLFLIVVPPLCSKSESRATPSMCGLFRPPPLPPGPGPGPPKPTSDLVRLTDPRQRLYDPRLVPPVGPVDPHHRHNPEAMRDPF